MRVFLLIGNIGAWLGVLVTGYCFDWHNMAPSVGWGLGFTVASVFALVGRAVE